MSEPNWAKGAHESMYDSGASSDREAFERAIDADLDFVQHCLDEVGDMPTGTLDQAIAKMVRLVKLMGRDMTQVKEDLGEST